MGASLLALAKSIYYSFRIWGIKFRPWVPRVTKKYILERDRFCTMPLNINFYEPHIELFWGSFHATQGRTICCWNFCISKTVVNKRDGNWCLDTVWILMNEGDEFFTFFKGPGTSLPPKVTSLLFVLVKMHFLYVSNLIDLTPWVF